MAILEVGKEKTFGTVGAAVKASKSGDEIRIYSGSYEELFDCTKKLTFTGAPSDMNDFSTYPVINGKKDGVSAVLKECKFSNMVFSADYTISLEKLNHIDTERKLPWWENQDMEKDMHSSQRDSHNNPYCLGIESTCTFENCAFVGAKKSAVAIGLMKENQKVVFNKCIFYGNSGNGLFVNGKMESTRVVLDKCIFNYGEFGIEIAGKVSVSINKSCFSNFTEQVISAGDDSKLLMTESRIFDSGAGIVLMNQAQAMVADSKIISNKEMGIMTSDKSEINIYGSEISKNRAYGIGLLDEALATVRESFIEYNNADGIQLCNNTKADVSDTTISDNVNGIRQNDISEVYVRKCEIANNSNCDLYQLENTSSFIEDSYFWNEAPARKNDEEIFVSVILANEATSVFQNCDFSAKQTKNVKLTMSADRTKVIYRNCNFHDAEDGIGIFDNSNCSVDECKFENISDLEIRMSGEKDSKLKVCDTELDDKTMEQFRVA